MIGDHRVGDMVQQRGLAGARRRDNQAARAFADRRDEIDDPRGVAVGDGFEHVTLVRIDAGQVVELLETDPFLRRMAVDLKNLRQLRAALLGRHGAALDFEAGRSLKFADDVRRHIDVVRADLEAAGGVAQKAEPFLADFQDTADLAIGWLLW
jgi:hypothetical protein